MYAILPAMAPHLKGNFASRKAVGRLSEAELGSQFAGRRRSRGCLVEWRALKSKSAVERPIAARCLDERRSSREKSLGDIRLASEMAISRPDVPMACSKNKVLLVGMRGRL